MMEIANMMIKHSANAPRTWGMMENVWDFSLNTDNRPTHMGNDGYPLYSYHAYIKSSQHVGNDGRQFGFTIIQNCLTHLGIDK